MLIPVRSVNDLLPAPIPEHFISFAFKKGTRVFDRVTVEGVMARVDEIVGTNRIRVADVVRHYSRWRLFRCNLLSFIEVLRDLNRLLDLGSSGPLSRLFLCLFERGLPCFLWHNQVFNLQFVYL